MIDDMIERILDVLAGHDDTCTIDRKVAVAILEAIREPTEQMLNEGSFEGVSKEIAADVWRFMIDAALEDDGA